MTIRTLMVAAVLAMAPGFAFAMGCNDHGADQASSCAEGFAWDKDTGSCVEQVTS